MPLVRIVLSGAENIHAVGNGSSDSYCIVDAQFGNVKKQFKTKTIKNSLDPNWNETFEVDGVEQSDLDQCSITFTVMEHEKVKTDDNLGFVKVPQKKLAQLKHGRTDLYESVSGRGKLIATIYGEGFKTNANVQIKTKVPKNSIEAKQAKFEESNIALIGSNLDIEQRVNAAKHEKEWIGVGKQEGIKIWRIEQFNVKPWSMEKYGQFFEGDSYIVLRTYKKTETSPSFSYNIHFWLGLSSTLDEKGTAAYKTVELDDLLGGTPTQYRECQGYESQCFVSLFKNGIKILTGGIDTGFHHVEEKTFSPRLYHVKGNKMPVVVEVLLTAESMNEGDVFILDNKTEVFVWIGKKANKNEFWKGITVAEEIHETRKGKSEITKLEQGSETDEFWSVLGGKKTIKSEKEVEGDLQEEAKREQELWELSEENGQFKFEMVQKGKIEHKNFNSDNVFIADVGDTIFTWIGSKSSKGEKAKAFEYALKYMEEKKRPQWLPIVKVVDGHESTGFLSYIKH